MTEIVAAGRIAGIQRQQRGLGKLRAGMTVPTSSGKTRPVASKTWIVTSADRRLVSSAAEVWGGTVEPWIPFGGGPQQFRVITERDRIPALLMPDNRLVQANELWNKGGCARRCNGQVERLSGKECLCAAEWGERFWAVAPADQVCDPTSRLKVLIPEIPQTLGTWMLETKSYYAAGEMSGFVDDLLGAVDPRAFVPVILGIERRSVRSGGGRKDFSVPFLELPEATANKVMGALAAAGESFGTAGELTGGPERRAITAGPAVPDYAAQIAAAETKADVRSLWIRAVTASHMNPELKALLEARAEELPEGAETARYQPTVMAKRDDEPVDAEWTEDEEPDEDEEY
jgi:hypothetical protein